MRSLLCMLTLTLIGCASPKPVIPTTAAVSPAVLSETDRAQARIDESIETGKAIETSDGQKLICRQESVANTRLRNRKTCLTEEQWRARSDAAKDSFRDASRHGLPPTERGKVGGY